MQRLIGMHFAAANAVGKHLYIGTCEACHANLGIGVVVLSHGPTGMCQACGAWHDNLFPLWRRREDGTWIDSP